MDAGAATADDDGVCNTKKAVLEAHPARRAALDPNRAASGERSLPNLATKPC